MGIQGITFTTYSSSKIKYPRSVNTFCVCKIESAKKRGIFSVFSTLLLPLEKKILYDLGDYKDVGGGLSNPPNTMPKKKLFLVNHHFFKKEVKKR